MTEKQTTELVERMAALVESQTALIQTIQNKSDLSGVEELIDRKMQLSQRWQVALIISILGYIIIFLAFLFALSK